MAKYVQNLPFKFVVSDLDGTLLNAEHTIGQFTIDTLHKVREKGVDIALATGRKYEDVAFFAKKIGISDMMFITSNGARIHDSTGQLLYQNSLPADIAHEILNTPFDRSKICANTYQDAGWFINIDIPALAKYHQDSGFTYQVVDFNQHNLSGMEKLFFIARKPEDLLDLEHYLRDKYGDVTEIVYSSLLCLEVMNKNVSKSNGIRSVIQNRDYTLQDCIAFGDGMNDEKMLCDVGKGCVMANANPALKKVTPHLEQIGCHQHEAVASYLRAIFAII